MNYVEKEEVVFMENPSGNTNSHPWPRWNDNRRELHDISTLCKVPYRESMLKGWLGPVISNLGLLLIMATSRTNLQIRGKTSWLENYTK